MSELRFDHINNTWTIISPERCLRPSDYVIEPDEKKCPFCVGNENLTPPEIYRLSNHLNEWETRVIPNKFPALKVEETLVRKPSGIFDIISGTGAHEVIIDTPNHDLKFTDYSVKELFNLYKMFQIRIADLKKDLRLRYILPFKNYGKEAGATLIHPHSQIIAMPEIPEKVEKLIQNSKNHFEVKERCLFCDIISEETRDNKRIITENNDFIAFCPFASTMPFEIRIFPKFHSSEYVNMNDKQLNEFANISENILKKLKKVKENISINMFIETAPHNFKNNGEKFAELGLYYHWFCVFFPRITTFGGFEFATGTTINTVIPEVAADFLRNVKI